MLRRWGNLGGIVLSTPAPLEDLCLLALQVTWSGLALGLGSGLGLGLTPPPLALQDPRSGWAEADGAQLDLARDAAALLAEKAEMLDPNPNPNPHPNPNPNPYPTLTLILTLTLTLTLT